MAVTSVCRRPGWGSCSRLDACLAAQVRAGSRGRYAPMLKARSSASMRIRADSASGTSSRSKISSAWRNAIRAASDRSVLSDGLADALQDFGFLVRVTDLPGQLERAVIQVERLAVATAATAYAGNPAQGGHLLAQVADLFGDRFRLVVADQRLVVALRALEDGADVVQYVGFVGQVADLPVDGQRPPVGGQSLVVAALVVIERADVVIQDRLALRDADFPEYIQRFLIAIQRVAVVAEVQLHPAQIVQRLSLAAPVPGRPVQQQRLTQHVHRLPTAAELPGGDPGVGQRIGHTVRVFGPAIQRPGLGEIGQCIPGPARPLVGQADLVQGLRLAAQVGQRPVNLRGLLGQRQRGIVLAGLLFYLAELQRRLRDPGRVDQVTAGLHGHGVRRDGVIPVRPELPGSRPARGSSRRTAASTHAARRTARPAGCCATRLPASRPRHPSWRSAGLTGVGRLTRTGIRRRNGCSTRSAWSAALR